MTVNGKAIEITPCITLAEFLTQQNYTITKIAVERNGDIVPKTTYKEVLLDPTDTLEIVHFVGGG